VYWYEFLYSTRHSCKELDAKLAEPREHNLDKDRRAIPQEDYQVEPARRVVIFSDPCPRRPSLVVCQEYGLLEEETRIAS
jgi:hypothetical protein